MSVDQLLERLNRARETAKAQLDAINSFGPAFEIRIKQAIRQRAIEDMDKVVQDLKAIAEKNKTDWNTDSFNNIETWISAAYDNWNNYVFIPSREQRKILIRVAISPGSGIVWLPATFFFNIIEELKASVLKGEMDEQIYLPGGKLVYDKMCEVSSSNIEKWKEELQSEHKRKARMKSIGTIRP